MENVQKKSANRIDIPYWNISSTRFTIFKHISQSEMVSQDFSDWFYTVSLSTSPCNRKKRAWVVSLLYKMSNYHLISISIQFAIIWQFIFEINCMWFQYLGFDGMAKLRHFLSLHLQIIHWFAITSCENNSSNSSGWHRNI